MKEINYIAELNLPSKSAYSIHVMKMCNAFSKAGYRTKLYVYTKKKDINLFKLYKCKNLFKIVGLNYFPINNSISRMIFVIKIFFIFLSKDKNNYIISRSILSALLLSLISEKVVLELHHELKSISKTFFYFFLNFYFFKKKIKLIFITKGLHRHFNIKDINYKILDDAVDLDDYKFNKKRINLFKNTCVYSGSFTKGKGVEKIIEIAKCTNKINFHLYGDVSNSVITLKQIKSMKNVFFKGFLPYNKVPVTLNQYDVLLLPYSKKVFVRSKNIEVGKFMSPMKLFEYLASKKIIIASNLPVYRHILNSKNSILLKYNAPAKIWAKKIEKVYSNKKIFFDLRKKSFATAKKYTWDLRVKKILNLFNI